MRKYLLFLLTCCLPCFVQAQSEVTIEATNLTVSDYTDLLGQCCFHASTSEYEVALWVETTSIYGTFAEEVDCGGSYVMVGDEEVGISSANVTVAEQNGQPVVTGTLTGKNDVVYKLKLSNVTAEKSREENVTFENANLEDNTADMGNFQVYGTDVMGSRYVSIQVNSNQIEGTYTLENLDKYYTYATETEGEDKILFSLIDAGVTVAFVDETTVYVGGKLLFQSTADATDCPEYNIEMTCKYTPSGILKVEKSNSPESLYNLHGVKVDEDYKGVVVKKGRRVVRR